MIIVVYFDVFYKTLISKLYQHKRHNILLVHYLNIPQNIIPTTLIIAGSKKRIMREPLIPLLNQLINKTTGYVIGICYGYQYLAKLSDGTLSESPVLFKRVINGHYYNHYDKVLKLPKLWIPVEYQDDFISVAIEPERKWIGFQFHPEKSDTDFKKYIATFI